MGDDLFNEVNYKSPTQKKVRVPAVRRSADRTDATKRVHAIFGLVAFVLAVAGAIFAYSVESSIGLSIFVFFVAQSYIARGLGDVVTDPEKPKRFVYFTLQPVFLIGVFSLSYVLWEKMWLSALLGIIVGSLVWQLLVLILFPGIHGEEDRDSRARIKAAGL